MGYYTVHCPACDAEGAIVPGAPATCRSCGWQGDEEKTLVAYHEGPKPDVEEDDEEEEEPTDMLDQMSIQGLIDSGLAWKMEGHIGRQCMAAIESGQAVLGPVGHSDYWGNYVPSRDEVQPGTKGSIEYARERGWGGEVDA